MPSCHHVYLHWRTIAGADPGEVKWVNFHPPPPFFRAPFFLFFFSYPSNIDWFYYIITKIHPPFQNPGSAPGSVAWLASYADALRARHAIFLPVGEEDFVTSPKSVCVGGYRLASLGSISSRFGIGSSIV